MLRPNGTLVGAAAPYARVCRLERASQIGVQRRMSVAVSLSSARPDVPELISRARDIAQLVRARAKQTELDRRVSEDVVDRMRKADLFRILQPQACGGFEYGFDVFVQIVAVIAGGCGSSGWVYGLLASHQWLTACFPAKAQEEFWRDHGAVAAGSYAPAGQGPGVNGGTELRGRWALRRRVRTGKSA